MTIRPLAALSALLLASCTGWLVPGVDGALGLDAPDPFYYGHPGVPVSVGVSNLGDTTAPGPVLVTVHLSPGVTLATSGPAGWTCSGASPTWTCTWGDALSAGGSLPDLELELAVGDPVLVRDELRVCAELSIEGDVNPANDGGCSAYPVSTPTAKYDLAITKELWTSFDPDTRQVGWYLEVTNLGPDPAMDVAVLEDVLPAGLSEDGFGWGAFTSCHAVPGGVGCEIPYVGVGQTRGVTVFAQVDEAVTGTVTNCASISAPQDFTPGNDQACSSFTIGQPEPFDLAVTAEIHQAPDGESPGVYRWFVENVGPNATTEPVEILIDAPPPGATLGYVSGIHASTPSPTNTVDCTPVGSQLACTIATTFQPGDVKLVWMSFYEDGGATYPACLSIDPPGDTEDANDDACLALDADPLPAGDWELAVKLAPLDAPTAEGPGAWRLTVTHTGQVAAPAPTVVSLRLPPGVSFVGVGGRSGFHCAPGDVTREGQRVTCAREAPFPVDGVEILDLAVWYEQAGDARVCADVVPSTTKGVCGEVEVRGGTP